MLKIFKRWLPAVFAGLLAFAYYHYTGQQQVQQASLAHAVKVGSLNADSALIAEAANTAVPPFGLLSGKLVFTLGLFFTGLAVVWFVMRFVVPVLPRWATGHGYERGGPSGQIGYAETFAAIGPEKRLRTFNLIWLGLLGYFVLCALAACLVS